MDLITEAARFPFADPPVTLTAAILHVLFTTRYKLTLGEINKIVQQLIPGTNYDSLRSIVSRLAKNHYYNIARTEIKPFMYWYRRPEPAVAKEDFEFKEFWDPDLPLFIHRILIMLENVPIAHTEKIDVPFMDHPEPIHFSFNANTKRLRIDFKCSNWKKTLDCNDFDAFDAVLKTVLQLKGLAAYADQMKVVNVDFNQDIEFTRIAGAKYVSVQGFKNALLVAYNKGTGYRKEQQFNRLNLPLDQTRKQLSRKTSELKIGTIFEKNNTILNQFRLSYNQSVSKLNSLLDYNLNTVQQLDNQIYDYYSKIGSIDSNINQIAQLQLQSNENNLLLLQRFDAQTDVILDHDENMRKQHEYLEEEIQTFRVISVNQTRSDSIQKRILQQLQEKDHTILELCKILKVGYNKLNYHLQKLMEFNEVTRYEEERTGRGARKQIYKVKK